MKIWEVAINSSYDGPTNSILFMKRKDALEFALKEVEKLDNQLSQTQIRTVRNDEVWWDWDSDCISLCPREVKECCKMEIWQVKYRDYFGGQDCSWLFFTRERALKHANKKVAEINSLDVFITTNNRDEIFWDWKDRLVSLQKVTVIE